DVFAGKKSAQIREILISESAWEEMTCLFAPSLSFLCIAKIKKQETALNSDKYMLKALFIRNFRISIYRYLTFPTRYCINGKHPLDYHG
ncbi:hypothetical protein LRP16_27585, partial [Klebsiella pneumoniae]